MTEQALTVMTEPTGEVGEEPKGGRPPKYAEPPTYEKLTPIDKQIVDYFAMDGLMPNNGEWGDKKGRMVQVTAQEFAESLGYVSRRSIYNRQNAIPGFDELVLARMPGLYRRYMVPAAWKGLGLRSMRGDAKQAEMLLSHYSNFVPPTQKHEVKIDGLAEAVNAARTAARQRSAIPGEVVEPKVSDSQPLPTVFPQPGDNPPTGNVAPSPNPGMVGGLADRIMHAETSQPEPEIVSIPAPNVNQIDDPVAKASANVNEIEANVAPKESPAPVKTSTPPIVRVNPDPPVDTNFTRPESADEFDEFGDRVAVREFE